MSNKKKIIDELSNLTIVEAAELIKTLEEKWGVSSTSLMQEKNNTEVKAKVEEKTKFDVVLSQIGNKKIQVIKTVKDITALGLKDAKSLVDQCPKNIKSSITKSEAEEIKQKLEKVGASVTIK